jgi:hypothetical protein
MLGDALEYLAQVGLRTQPVELGRRSTRYRLAAWCALSSEPMKRY